MIKLSGVDDIEIVEIGLRPGEKLYEELLVKSAELGRTNNEKIFIEQDEALPMDVISEKLKLLQNACGVSNDAVREVLHQVVSTYKEPEEVNWKAYNN